jgi:two-component system nitrogen regulation sensor histidine kinase GlnL
MVIELNSVERHHRIQTEEALLMQTQASAAVMRGLAHEVKNPLGGIRGAAQLLERELEDQRQAEYTQIIIGEVDRLRNLVDRMLGPPGEPCAAPVNIHDVLEHVTHIVDAESAGSSVIRRDYDPSIPELFADRDQLIQAFLNIVRNAMQALHAVGGTIELKTRIQRNLTIGPKMHSLVARVDVIDSGPGVNPEIADSIFYPMVSGRAEGSGLGLPLAQSLLNRQGGLVEFASEPGHTVFTVWLPIGTEK